MQLAPSVGGRPEAAEADALESGWKDVLGKSLEEFHGGEGRGLCGLGRCVGCPGVGDGSGLGVMGGDAAGGDGDAVDVGSQVFQDGFWSREGWFDPQDGGGVRASSRSARRA